MSTLASSNPLPLLAVGEGTASTPDLASMKPTQKASLYADPLSWLVLSAVESAVASTRDALDASRRTVGHIVISDTCTLHTLHAIARTVPSGHVSPLKFSGACPGLVCCLPSQLLGFSGPSIALSMLGLLGQPHAMTLAQTWLKDQAASHVIVTVHDADASGHRVTSTVFTCATSGETR
ncbi:hypothetical protein [Zymobacter sp. IVIA_5232.4 C2]|uniref:hypothetical protein n=1 Tax=Zymobacter sp. IVIA_5232.4 C2 TaxID=3394855 RepID=UPI0039C2763C